MNKRILVLVALLAGALLSASTAQAGFYPGDDGTPLKVGDCTLVNKKSDASATQVYTLNPSMVQQLNTYYGRYLGRSARCDELQFHVDHNTSISKLEKWLIGVATQRLQSGYYNGKTVSTYRNEWFWVDKNAAHRIPDWLTGLSNGMLFGDRISLTLTNSTLFYKYMAIGSPVSFSKGQYAAKITKVWKNDDRDYSSLPTRLGNEIDSFVNNVDPYYKSIFSLCTFRLQYGNQAYWDNLDWSWMLHNPGCALAGS